MRAFSIITALFLSACVTINIYFPAAAAEKVADEIIQGIQNEAETELETNEPEATLLINDTVSTLLKAGLNFIIPSAHAAADLSVNTAEIRQLRAQMKSRFPQLNRFYQSGQLGIQSNGYLATHGKIALKDKNLLNKLINAENANRKQLYQLIANANGHPEWFNKIQATFAKRWLNHAKKGWWIQNQAGKWQKK